MNDIYIPETPQQLEPQWLSDVLSLGGVRVTSTQQQVLGDGEGFVGDILQLKLQFDAQTDAPQSVIAKLPKLENRAMGELIGAYERENMFYMTMANGLPVNAPEMYYGEFDRDAASEKQEEILRSADKLPSFLHGVMNKLAWWIAARKNRRYILLLEDISDAQPFDQLAGASREDYAAILRAVAKLHAHYWGSDDLSNHFWLLPMDIDINMRYQMMLRARANYEKLFADVTQQGMGTYLDELQEQGLSIARGLCTGPITLLHGDLRLDNLFSRDGEVVFIDWQLVRRGPPAYDVAYLLSCGLHDQESADPLLAIYHQALVDAGVADYSFEELLADYRLALKSVLMNLSTVDQVDLGSGRGVVLLEAWMQRLLWRLQTDT